MSSIITLTGDIGSGKSEVSNILAERLNFKKISTGYIQRQIAKERNITPLELNEISMKNREIDDHLDGFLKKLNEDKDSYIIDSRLAWYFVQDSFKVFIKIDPKIAAERIFSAQRPEEKNLNLEETFQRNIRRQWMERERFMNLYKIDFLDLSYYDLVIDSSSKGPSEVAEEIIRQFKISQEKTSS